MSTTLPEKHLAVCLLSVVPATELVRLARVADEAGLRWLWISEGYHYFRRLGEPSSSTSIAAAAAVLTKRDYDRARDRAALHAASGLAGDGGSHDQHPR